MLSSHDADVVARDPGLPGARLLLDPQAVRSWLRGRLGEAVETVRPRYLRYKPGTRLLVAFDLQTSSGAVVPFHAWAVDRTGLPKFLKWSDPLEAAVAPGAVRVVAQSHRVVGHLFPEDRRLPTLARLAHSREREAFFARRIPACVAFGGLPAHTVSYKPERRFVLRMDAPRGPVAAVRGCLPGAFRQTLRGARAFEANPGSFRIPRVLGWSERAGVVVQEWIPGRALDLRDPWGRVDGAAPILGGDAEAIVHHLGSALAGLHRHDAPSLQRRSPRWEGQGLRAAAGAVAAVCPDDTGRKARRLAAHLRSRLEVGEGRTVPLHGDLHPGQVMLQADGGLGLVDFDRVCLGEAEADLASFAAALERMTFAGDIPPHRVSRLETALLDGYRVGGGRIDPVRYRLQKAASLLRLAPHPFRDREPDWRARTRALVHLARASASSAGANSGAPSAGGGEALP